MALFPLSNSTDAGWTSTSANLKDSKIDNLASLLAIIQPFQITSSRSDSRLWIPSNSGTFSVSSFFSAISSSSSSFPHRPIWFPLSPSKVQAFLRKVAWNRGPLLTSFKSSSPHFIYLQTIASCASLQLNPTLIWLSIALLAGGCEANFLSWLTSTLWCRLLTPKCDNKYIHIKILWKYSCEEWNITG